MLDEEIMQDSESNVDNAVSKAFDRNHRICLGYQGARYSNAHSAANLACIKYHLVNVEQVPLISSENVIEALANGEIDFGIMAIRNSLVGEVKETAAALANASCRKLGEFPLPIHHCLFAYDAPAALEIDTIASHIQALRQTHRTLSSMFGANNIERMELEDTAKAAEYLSLGKLSRNVGVICSKAAGEANGLHLVAENIEDSQDNFTTFGLFAI